MPITTNDGTFEALSLLLNWDEWEDILISFSERVEQASGVVTRSIEIGE